jgi:hypothetical protein
MPDAAASPIGDKCCTTGTTTEKRHRPGCIQAAAKTIQAEAMLARLASDTMIPRPFALSIAPALLCVTLLAPGSAAAQSAPQPQPSQNWSGYIGSNAYYTGVSALIQTPVATGQQQTTSAVASWVGIGGSTSPDLIQAGVEVDTSGPVAQYHAWFETLPQASRNVALNIGPGDWVSVDVHELAFDQWQITIIDGQQVFQRQIQYVSSHSSAEWIVEDPSAARGLVPLATVTGANFANMTAVANGQPSVPAQLSPQTTVLVGAGGQVESSPSVLGPDGNSFGVAATL